MSLWAHLRRKVYVHTYVPLLRQNCLLTYQNWIDPTYININLYDFFCKTVMQNRVRSEVTKDLKIRILFQFAETSMKIVAQLWNERKFSQEQAKSFHCIYVKRFIIALRLGNPHEVLRVFIWILNYDKKLTNILQITSTYNMTTISVTNYYALNK